MRFTIAAIGLSLLPLACTPKAPGEGDSASDSSSSESGSGTLGGTTAGISTSGASDSGSTTDTTGSTVPTTGEPTTGEQGVICPEDQPKLSPLWSDPQLAFPPGDELLLVRSIAALDDGRLAIGGFRRTLADDHAPGVFWVAADGTPIGWKQGAMEAAELDVIAVRADGDSVVVLGPRAVDGVLRPYAARFAADGQELTRVELQTQSLNWPLDFELRGDSAVVIGYDRPSHHAWLAEVDVATGEPAWEVMLPGQDGATERVVAVGPAGEIVAGQGNPDDADHKLWRVDDQGAVLWESDLKPGPGSGQLTELLITTDGQVVAVTTEFSPTPKITMIAVALADGAPTWTLDVAVANAAGDPVLQHGLVEPGALVLPIARGPNFWDAGGADPLTAELHRVSFTGEVLDVTPLPLAGISSGPAWLAAARGACGDLVAFLAFNEKSWLGSFAP